ncbi:MAG: GAF domain-containing protein, partial [Actinophytocola sp.]|nr:GAF domain-containing protein [Actinophytocola sp.]
TSVVLQRIVEIAAELTGARYAALGVLDEEGHRLAEFLTIGVTPEERARIGNLPEGHGILGVLIKDPRPLRLRELSRDPRSVGFPPNHPPMSSFLGAPVKARGAVFGNLYLTEKQGAEEFTVEDEHTLTLLAAQAGVAIENARLFEANAGRERRLTAGRQISMAILENRDTAMVLGMVASRAREFTGSDLAMVATVVEGGEALVVRVAHGAGADALEGTKLPMEG